MNDVEAGGAYSIHKNWSNFCLFVALENLKNRTPPPPLSARGGGPPPKTEVKFTYFYTFLPPVPPGSATASRAYKTVCPLQLLRGDVSLRPRDCRLWVIGLFQLLPPTPGTPYPPLLKTYNFQEVSENTSFQICCNICN